MRVVHRVRKGLILNSRAAAFAPEELKERIRPQPRKASGPPPRAAAAREAPPRPFPHLRSGRGHGALSRASTLSRALTRALAAAVRAGRCIPHPGWGGGEGGGTRGRAEAAVPAAGGRWAGGRRVPALSRPRGAQLLRDSGYFAGAGPERGWADAQGSLPPGILLSCCPHPFLPSAPLFHLSLLLSPPLSSLFFLSLSTDMRRRAGGTKKSRLFNLSDNLADRLFMESGNDVNNARKHL